MTTATTPEIKAVAKKVLQVMEKIGYVQKDGTNKFQKYNYVGEANIVEQIRGAMVECKLVAIPNVVSFEVIPAGQTKNGAQQFLTTILTKYTVIDTDSGQFLDCTMLGQGHDTGDKGAYKAATGVNKYFLMKLYQIATGDSPEGGDPERDNVKVDPESRVEPVFDRATTITRITTGLMYLYPEEALLRAEMMAEHTGGQNLLIKCNEDELKRLWAAVKIAARDKRGESNV